MISYRPTATDRAPLPAAFGTEARYLGYREPDRAKPYARYFRTDVRPVQDHVRDALLGGMAPTEHGYHVSAAARRMSRPGYDLMETGWTRVPGGYLVSCLTDMPGVTARMCDWWFGWHGVETARYKLWHPGDHRFTALGEDRSGDRTLTDRQRYVDNVSYVDEYIGGTLNRLAIRFLDPSRLGFDDPGPGGTVICARVGLSTHPVAQGWLIHQVRPTSHGCEMRSRFFLDDAEILDLRPHAAPGRGARLLTGTAVRTMAGHLLPHLSRAVMGRTFGHDLLFHCATEMNHLAGFLPELYEEFRDVP